MLNVNNVDINNGHVSHATGHSMQEIFDIEKRNWR